MADVVNVSDADFEDEVLKADRPVLVDFWAEWCGPCRQISPIIKQLAEDYDGRIKVVKLNVDESPQTAGQFGIRSIPTILAFRNGQVIEQLMGARPRASFEELAEKIIA